VHGWKLSKKTPITSNESDWCQNQLKNPVFLQPVTQVQVVVPFPLLYSPCGMQSVPQSCGAVGKLPDKQLGLH
jgi:hypothetical protein